MPNHTPHTPETLAQSALDAIGAFGALDAKEFWHRPRAASRMAAIEYVANATLEEIEDKTPVDLELVLEAILVLTL